MFPEQIVQLVPAEGGLSDQVLVIQLIELAAGFAQASAVQRGDSIGVEGRSRDQAEPAEQPLLAWTEILVGQVEGGRHRQILRPHQFRPVCCRCEVCHHALGGLGRVVAQLAGDQPDRQGQVPAQPGNLAHRRIGGVDPGPGRQPGQQRAASRGGRMSRLMTAASSSAASRRRLVSSTRLPPVPGSSGRTCSWLAASSSSSRIFLPAT